MEILYSEILAQFAYLMSLTKREEVGELQTDWISGEMRGVVTHVPYYINCACWYHYDIWRRSFHVKCYNILLFSESTTTFIIQSGKGPGIYW